MTTTTKRWMENKILFGGIIGCILGVISLLLYGLWYYTFNNSPPCWVDALTFLGFLTAIVFSFLPYFNAHTSFVSTTAHFAIIYSIITIVSYTLVGYFLGWLYQKKRLLFNIFIATLSTGIILLLFIAFYFSCIFSLGGPF